MTPTDTMTPTGRILEIRTVAEYYRDPCETPSLTASIAKTLLLRSPAHARLEHPRLGGRPRLPSRSMQTGTAVHALVLDAGGDIVPLDFPDYRTKAAQAAREALAAGKTPMLDRDMREAQASANVIRRKLADLGIGLEGVSELPICWTETTSGGEAVLCRALLDHVDFEQGLIVDLKTCESAKPSAMSRQSYELGYDLQAAAYTRAVAAVRPDLAGRIQFVFAFAETEAPFAVTVARPSGTMRELGARRWQRAIDIWERCLRTDTWPDYADGVVELGVPAWALALEQSLSDEEQSL